MNKTDKQYQVYIENRWEPVPEEIFEKILTQCPYGGDVPCGVVKEMRDLLSQGRTIALLGLDYRIRPKMSRIKTESGTEFNIYRCYSSSGALMPTEMRAVANALNDEADKIDAMDSIHINQCHKDDTVVRVPDEIMEVDPIILPQQFAPDPENNSLHKDFVPEPEVKVTYKEFWEHVEKISEIYQSWPQWKKDLYKDE
jgi:hypothetical protein